MIEFEDLVQINFLFYWFFFIFGTKQLFNVNCISWHVLIDWIDLCNTYIVYTVVGKDSSCKLKIEKQINGTKVKNKTVDI